MKAFADGGREGLRWGMPYFYQCWLGLMEWTVPLVIDGAIKGVLVCGQVLIKDLDDLFYEDVINECRRLGIGLEQANGAIEHVRVITPQQSRAAAELLQVIANQVSSEGAEQQKVQRHRTEAQQRIAESIHGQKLKAGPCYPIELETQLIGHVRLGEVKRAKEILNHLLGEIYTRDMGNIPVLKARLIELLAILSRAAVEAGGELEETLGANLSYLQEIHEANTAEDMSMVVVQALDRFTQGVYRTRNTEQLRILGDALAYIRRNAAGELSLDDVARACHKNPSTLRKLFREQLGQTFSDYLNRVRVEQAIEKLKDPNRSLAEIAVEVGFYDQSHFGKVFRQVTGYTPALYRKKAL
jgi:two-component system response regulator YesN